MLQAYHLIKGTIELPNVIGRNIQTLLELVVSSISAPQEIVCPFLSDSCNEFLVF
jgi:RNAse (barnase) inhibitor barstar